MSYFFILLILLLLSAFFSGSETAFFSLTRLELKEFSEQRELVSRTITQLLQNRERLLITILLGNNLVNIAIATIAAVLTHERLFPLLGVSPTLALILDVVVVTFVLLLVGEITPKVVAVRNNRGFVRLAAQPVWFFSLLFRPVILPLEWFMRRLPGRDGARERVNISESELQTLVEVGSEHGTLEEEAREMISSIFEFSHTLVKEIMVPRIDMVAVEDTVELEELVRLIREHGHSRIPVYSEDVDHIQGILYAKDLIPFLMENSPQFSLAPLLREPYFAPETKPIDDLLSEFQSRKIHMAIVVDEYGGTAGLVTLEDIIEEIVGEIQDEFDDDKPLFQKLDENTWLVNARLSISDLNDRMGEEALSEEEDYESLGGFIFQQAGEVPQVNNHFEFLGYRFTVVSMDGHRLEQIKIERLPETEEHDTKSRD